LSEIFRSDSPLVSVTSIVRLARASAVACQIPTSDQTSKKRREIYPPAGRESDKSKELRHTSAPFASPSHSIEQQLLSRQIYNYLLRIVTSIERESSPPFTTVLSTVGFSEIRIHLTSSSLSCQSSIDSISALANKTTYETSKHKSNLNRLLLLLFINLPKSLTTRSKNTR
jgi:hypothetical protein